MMDIVEIPYDGRDLQLQDSSVPKAVNVASVQIGSLEYAPTFGADLAYFLQSDFVFQNSSFKSYLVQRFAEFDINATQVTELIDSLFHQYTFSVKDNDPQVQKGGLIL